MTDAAPPFAMLPRPETADGAPRRIGVEIELGGLSEHEVARVAQRVLGGRLEPGNDPAWFLRDSAIGALEIYLDTPLRLSAKSQLRDAALALGREVIPVEIVSDPLDHEGLERLSALTPALCDAGARGSSAGVFFGFGVHFNVEIVSDAMADIRATLTAYALLEDWLRDALPIDETRRLLPFTQPYPTSFVRALLDLPEDAPLAALIDLYVAHNPTRNRGLDMLPIFAHLAPAQLSRVFPDPVNSRPTFHFRLPDSRIDEPRWSLACEWDRWVLVETVAGNPDLMRGLALAWRQAHEGMTLLRHSWAQRCGDILLGAGLTQEPLA